MRGCQYLTKYFVILCWAIVVLSTAVLLGFIGQGYDFKVSSNARINYAPEEHDKGACLYYDVCGYTSEHVDNPVITNITGFMNVNDYIVGKASAGYFIMNLSGKVTPYGQYDSWISACQNIDRGFAGNLKKPSHLHSPRIMSFIVPWTAWIVACTCICVLLQRRLNDKAPIHDEASVGNKQ